MTVTTGLLDEIPHKTRMQNTSKNRSELEPLTSQFNIKTDDMELNQVAK